MKWLRVCETTPQDNQNIYRALASIWFSNSNWDHGDNGMLKECDSCSNSFWWDYMHMTCSLLQENLEPFPDTTAGLSILSSLLPVTGDVRRLVRAKKKEKNLIRVYYFEDQEATEVKA